MAGVLSKKVNPQQTKSSEAEPNRFRSLDNMALIVPAVEQHAAVMAFSLRSGGSSPAPFDSLNFSSAQGDAPENVRENLEILGELLQFKPSRLGTCIQVHGDEIAVLDSVPEPRPTADAVVTQIPDLYLAVRTADCVPILLLDPVLRVSAAIHAGWRSTVKRITHKVLKFMQTEFGSEPENIIAAVGPAVGSCCYQVEAGVLDLFRGCIPDVDRFISPTKRTAHDAVETGFLDLPGINRWELLAGGVLEQNMYSADLCTCCNPDLLFSYRREGARSGRHIAIVGFRR